MDDTDELQILDTRRAHGGFFALDVIRFRHRTYDGGWMEDVTREVLRMRRAAAVLLYDPARDEMVLIEQVRIAAHAAGRPLRMLEVVAGMVDEAETPADVAVREAKEEAGLEVTALQFCHDYLPVPGAVTEVTSVYVGRVDASRAGGVHGLDHEHEDIRVIVYPAAEVVAMLDANRLDNAATLVALQWFARHGDELRRRWLAEG